MGLFLFTTDGINLYDAISLEQAFNKTGGPLSRSYEEKPDHDKTRITYTVSSKRRVSMGDGFILPSNEGSLVHQDISVPIEAARRLTLAIRSVGGRQIKEFDFSQVGLEKLWEAYKNPEESTFDEYLAEHIPG